MVVRVAALASLAACGRIDFDPASRDAAPAAIEFVQDSAGSGGNGPTGSLALARDAAQGDLIIATVSVDLGNGAPTLLGIDAPAAGAFTMLGPYDNTITHARLYLAYAVAPSAGPIDAKFTLDAGEQDLFDVRLLEYSGLATGDPLDVVVSASGDTTGTDAAQATITTSADDELVFGFAVVSLHGMAGAGFNMRDNFDGDVSEDLVAPAAGPVEVTATLTDGTGWDLAVAAFRGR